MVTMPMFNFLDNQHSSGIYLYKLLVAQNIGTFPILLTDTKLIGTFDKNSSQLPTTQIHHHAVVSIGVKTVVQNHLGYGV